MKLNLRKSWAKQAVRATALAGTAVLALGFATTAQANTAPAQPYKIWVAAGGSIPVNEYGFVQVCGYKDISGVGHWRCTDFQNATGHATNYMGSDWLRGKINVWEYFTNNPLLIRPDHAHTCNTNGAYYGHLQTGGVVLTHKGGTPLGDGDDPC